MIKMSQRITFRDEAELELTRFVDEGCDLPTQRKFKDSGAMIAPATIARTGIMNYSAGQCGKLFSDWPATKVVRVMTRAEDLFHADSLELYRSAPITIGHPDEDVSIDNAGWLQKGNLDGIPFQDGEQLAGHVVLTHKEALDLVDAGVSQLSSGHDATLIRLSDEDAARLGYDAYKTNIRPNHVAIVPKGRAGSARIADEDEGAGKTKEDEGQVKMYDQAHVSGLEAQLEASVTLADGLKAEVQELKLKITDEAIQVLVNKRLEFMTEVAQFTDADISGMSELDAKKIAIKDACGKDYSDRDEHFINARYSILLEEGTESGGTDISQAFRDHIKDPEIKVKSEPTQSESARQRMIDRQSK